MEVRSANSHTLLTSALSYITPDRLRVLSMELCLNVNISSIFVQVLLISGSFNETVIRKAGYITQLNNWKSEKKIALNTLTLRSTSYMNSCGDLKQNGVLYVKAMAVSK